MLSWKDRRKKKQEQKSKSHVEKDGHAMALELPDPLADLPQHFRDEIELERKIVNRSVSFRELFRFATRLDRILILIAVGCAIAAGTTLPLMTIIFGSLVNSFTGFLAVDPATGLPAPTVTPDEFQGKVNHLTLYFVYLFIASFWIDVHLRVVFHDYRHTDQSLHSSTVLACGASAKCCIL